jgi:hypothetical protein
MSYSTTLVQKKQEIQEEENEGLHTVDTSAMEGQVDTEAAITAPPVK